MEQRLTNGLLTGHAYAISDVRKVWIRWTGFCGFVMSGSISLSLCSASTSLPSVCRFVVRFGSRSRGYQMSVWVCMLIGLLWFSSFLQFWLMCEICLLVTTMSCAKTAEPIKIPFALRSHVGATNRVLVGIHIPHGKGQFFIPYLPCPALFLSQQLLSVFFPFLSSHPFHSPFFPGEAGWILVRCQFCGGLGLVTLSSFMQFLTDTWSLISCNVRSEYRRRECPVT